MQKLGEEVHLDVDEARSGETPHIVRYVLAISLLLAILTLSAIWMTGAFFERSAPNSKPMSAVEHSLGG